MHSNPPRTHTSKHSNITEGLNAQQHEGVMHTDGPMLIVAGAGSGKTTVLTRRAARLIVDGVAPDQILIVTFTNKAAGELRERLVDLVGDDGRRVLASTFHSFCLRELLQKYSPSIGMPEFTIIDDGDQTSILKEILKGLTPSEKEMVQTWGIKVRDIRSEMSLARASGMTPQAYLNDISSAAEDYPLRLITESVWKQYIRVLEKESAVDFDGMLEYGLEILKTNDLARTTMQRRFRHIMVDEFQDTNQIQAAIIRLITPAGNNITVVGDARQSIYGFRGSEIKIILDFENTYPGARILELPINYRSTGPIVDVANRVSGNMKQKVGELEMEAGGHLSRLQAPPVYCEFQTDEEEADGIAKQILERTRNGTPGGDIAILYRSRLVKEGIEKALIAYGIPYVVIGDMSFFQRKEIKDAIALLRIANNPSDGYAWLRLVDAIKPGISVAAIKKSAVQTGQPIAKVIQQKAEGSGKAATKLRAIIATISEAAAAASTPNPSLDLLHEAWEDLLKPSVLKTVATQMKMVTAEAREKAVQKRIQNVEELFRSVAEKIESSTFSDAMDDLALLANPPTNAREDDKTVKMMTIHASKGLEFEHVYLPALENGILPSGNIRTEDDFEEEKRIFYVAITRAKRTLNLSWVFTRVLFGKPTSMDTSGFVGLIACDLQEGACE